VEFYVVEAILGAMMFGIGGVFFKWNAHHKGDEDWFFSGLYLVGSLCFFINAFSTLPTDDYLIYIIMAALIGLGSAGGNYAFSIGLKHGPAGLSSSFAKSNIIIVILLSSLYYGEKIGILESAGIFLILLAMLVVNMKMKGKQRSVSRIWFLLMLSCMFLLSFRNGGLKIAEELQISSSAVLALAYFYCAVYFFSRVFMKRNRSWPSEKSKSHIFLIGGITGTVSFTGLYFYAAALNKGPGSIVVTLFSLDMIFILILSYLIFGERLNRNQKLGFILSATGFLLIGLQ